MQLYDIEEIVVKYRQACEQDIDRIMEILKDGKLSLGLLNIDQWQGDYPKLEIIQSDVEQGASFVVEDDGHVVGTAMTSYNGESIYDDIQGAWLTSSDSTDPHYVVIHRVAVSRDSLGKGVASFLLAEAEKAARKQGCESVRIDTHEGNTPMRSLLTKSGYTECGIVLIEHAEEATPERIAYEKIL